MARWQAVSAVEITDQNTLYVNEDGLKDILLDENIRDLPVVVISIAGAYRTGKSFMLNYLLRYLRNGCTDNWFAEHDVAMDGFPWSRGSERNTKGILLWNEVFRVTVTGGQEVAVVLMDTQGTFDCKSTKAEAIGFFAMSTLLSSVMVYNITKNIQEDHLEHLWLFTHYAKLAKKGDSGKPFQKLLFLVRDWNFPFDAEYGAEGGQKLLKRRLEYSGAQSSEMCDLQKEFISSFEAIECFLMPHPGLQMIQKTDFRGALADLEEDFRQHLRQLVFSILAPKNLVVKIVNQETITCKDLIPLFQSYAKVFNEGTLPAPQSILEANAKQQLEVAKRKGSDYYESIMEERCNYRKDSLTENEMESGQRECGEQNDFLPEAELNRIHREALGSALALFDSTPKLNCGTLVQVYRDRMKEVIKEQFKGYYDLNMMKIAIHNMKMAAGSAENAENKKKPDESSIAAFVRSVASWLRRRSSWARAFCIALVLYGTVYVINKYWQQPVTSWIPSLANSNNHAEAGL